MNRARIDISRDKVADFCRQHHIRKLALFGSALRDDYRPDSDVDVLVEFERGRPVGLFDWRESSGSFPNCLAVRST